MGIAQLLASVKRQLERGAGYMRCQHTQVIWRNARMFRCLLEQIIRVLRQILIQRISCVHHHRDRGLEPAPGPPGLLPKAGDGAGVAQHHTRIQLTDVYAQLQRIRRHHPTHTALAQTLLNGAALFGQVAAAIAEDREMSRLRRRDEG